ncbi:MAG: diguanylate cyclase [Planctomycetota bacterium]|nr:diguanylate cyclase [Planctomycetota bacterium]
MKVLLIDDSPDALNIAKARLIKDGLDVICANSGREGLEAARRETPDLILLDVDMPDMSGFDVCRKLKSDAELCMIPVIFLTGSTDSTDKVEGLDLGAVDYVTKPFDAFELNARVRAALRSKHLQDLLIERARIDPLTELWNRRALMDRLEQEQVRIQLRGGSIACIIADLDHFKYVNDNYGHRVGDKILRLVAKGLTDQCRQSDLVARYGGEEFVILVPDEGTEGAATLAERCRRQIENIRLRVGEQEISVTASFGVADMTNLSSSETFIESADAALYRAKHAGRNRVTVASTEESVRRRLRCNFHR